MRNILTLIMLGSLVLVAACSSSTSAFHKQLEEANNLMNEMKYEEALAILSELEEDFLPGDTYETGRSELVTDLIYNAEYMTEHVNELKGYYQEAMEAYKAATNEEANIDLYQEAIRSLDYAINSFNDMEELEIYQELVDARNTINEKIDGLVATLTANLDESLDSQDFAKAESSLSELHHLHNSFPEQVGEKVTQYEEKLEAERERFAYMPELVSVWQETIHENEDGSIKFEGIRNADGAVDVVVSYNGYYSSMANKISLNPEIILSNGDTVSGDNESTRNLSDMALKTYRFYSYDEFDIDDIVRFHVELPFVQEDVIRFDFTGVDESEEFELPGVMAIKEVYYPEWQIEHEQMDVEIKSLVVDPYEIKISGVIKPKNDTTIGEYSYAYLPFSEQLTTTGSSWYSDSETELYEGTEKEFEKVFSFDKPITEFEEYFDLHLYEHNFLVDLGSGEIYEKEEPTFIENLVKLDSNNYVEFDSYNQRELINQAGERVAVDSMLITNNDYNSYHLGNRFDKLTATIHVHKDTTGADFGTTELTIYSRDDDEDTEIYSTKIEANHKSSDIEVDVSGVENLIIVTDSDYGNEGSQHIILENPIVE